MKRMVLLLAMAVSFQTGSLLAHEGGDHDEAKEGIASGETTQAKKYVCPMHADVQSDKPGQCPKCGMTLKQTSQEEETGKESHEGHTHEYHP